MNTPKQTTEKVNSLAGIREAILDTMARRLHFEDQTIEQFRLNGRLDEVMAADSILVIELVLMLEDHFEIRFDPEHIDAELICDLDRLTEFISQGRTSPGIRVNGCKRSGNGQSPAGGDR